jgi:hypothetical protein
VGIMQKNKINIYEIIGNLAPYMFMYGASVNFEREPNNNRIRIKIKDLMIKGENTDGIIIENMIVSLANIKDTEINESIKNADIIVEHFNVLIPENWINLAFKTIEKQNLIPDVKDLKVVFRNQVMSLHGAYKKGITFGFTVDLKFKVINDRIIIDFDRFWVGSTIPMPQIFQKTLLNFAENYLNSHKNVINGITLLDQNIHIDHLQMIPPNVQFFIRNIHIDDGYFVIQGGVDFNEALDDIKTKEAKLKMDELIEQNKQNSSKNGETTEITVSEEKTDIINEEPEKSEIEEYAG